MDNIFFKYHCIPDFINWTETCTYIPDFLLGTAKVG